MRVFLTICFGQGISMLGSSLTGFAIGIWVYTQNQSVTEFAFITVASQLPGILIAPLAGALVDRWDRRWVLVASDLGSTLCTVAIFVLLWTEHLNPWHIYATAGFRSIFNAFQDPAWKASITMLVPKQHLGRANGIDHMAAGITRVISPALGGFLLFAIDLEGIVLVDLVTFLVAIFILFFVRIPQPKPEHPETGIILKAAKQGLAFIRQNEGFIGLLVFFALINLCMATISFLAVPLILSFSDAKTVGVVLSTGGFGMMTGSLLMGIWGGPKRLMNGIFGFMLFVGLSALLAAIRPSAFAMSTGAFFFFLSIPFILGCSNTLWQRKVPANMQGRVFAVRHVIAAISVPIATVIGGPLADQVFEPMMASGGALAPILGPLFGTGTGRGMAVMFSSVGLLALIVTVVAYQFKSLRNLQENIPDAIP